MPYPESCPECGGAFRNTGTHFTARRNEIGRHVLLELGCQNTARRYWWDFTTGSLTEDGRTVPARRNGAAHVEANGHSAVATLERAEAGGDPESDSETNQDDDMSPQEAMTSSQEPLAAEPIELPTGSSGSALRDAFVRQLQLDRLTLRQMRSWLMADEARRAIEVAAGATEATYERLALILFGVDLQRLLGKQVTLPANTGMSAEERLELQREKARIRARLRRAAAKSARQT